MAVNGELVDGVVKPAQKVLGAGGVITGTGEKTTITIEDGERLINPTTGDVHQFSAADGRFHYVGRFDPQAVLRNALERMDVDA